jgi:ankyrin repeat protein
LEHVALRLHYAQPSFSPKFRAVTKVLLDAGASYSILAATYLNDPDRVGVILKDDPKQALNKTLLLEASEGGYTAIVKLLLDHKADPNATTVIGNDPVLYLALEHPDVVRLLIKAGADPKVSTEEFIKEAWGIRDKMTLLHHAAKKGLVETAKLLLEGGADINSRASKYEMTPLEIAAECGHPEMVELLLKNKASVKDDDGLQILEAAFRDISLSRLATFRSIITLLSEAGVPLNLHAVVVLGDVNRVRKLLKDQPDLAETIFCRKTPLYWAVDLNELEMVATLLDVGVPIESETIQSSSLGGPGLPGVGRMGGHSTALHLATCKDKEKIAKLLIDRKADVNARDEYGATPLHKAANTNAPKVAKLLIDAKADVNTRDKYGATPLHEAARCGNLAVAKLLLAAGADVNAKDDKNKTPLAGANESDKEIIELLKKHGGK